MTTNMKINSKYKQTKILLKSKNFNVYEWLKEVRRNCYLFIESHIDICKH